MIDYTNLDLTGVKPTSVKLDTIYVKVQPEVMVDDYATAFVKECQRINPRRFEQAPISDEEMKKYCRYLLSQRIACIEDSCKDWRMLKNLYIPVFIQYAMSLVGVVDIKDKGLRLVPVMEEDESMTLEEALDLSDRIGLFEHDVQVRKDAMPRSKDGDLDTMSCALIAGYIRSISAVDHPVATYVAAFMGFELQKEQAFQVLYRVQYDDLEFIRAALTHNHVVMGNVSET